jgi:hypothetical protein
VFRENHLVGAILLGEASLSARIKKAVEERYDCSELLRERPGAARVLEFFENPHSPGHHS